MVTISQGLGQQHLRLKPGRAKSTQLLWKSAALAFLGLPWVINASGKLEGKGEAPGQPSTVSLCWAHRQSPLPCGTGASPEVLIPPRGSSVSRLWSGSGFREMAFYAKKGGIHPPALTSSPETAKTVMGNGFWQEKR